jgi:hypothetical protein
MIYIFVLSISCSSNKIGKLNQKIITRNKIEGRKNSRFFIELRDRAFQQQGINILDMDTLYSIELYCWTQYNLNKAPCYGYFWNLKFKCAYEAIYNKNSKKYEVNLIEFDLNTFDLNLRCCPKENLIKLLEEKKYKKLEYLKNIPKSKEPCIMVLTSVIVNDKKIKVKAIRIDDPRSPVLY